MRTIDVMSLQNYGHPGLGYAPGSGPYVGYPSVVDTYFGDSMDQLLPNSVQGKPNQWSFGSTLYINDNLMGLPKNSSPNMRTFPNLGAYPGEVGPGINPGGLSGPTGVWGPLGSPLSYSLNFGRKRRKSKRKPRRKSRRKSRRKLRRRSIKR